MNDAKVNGYQSASPIGAQAAQDVHNEGWGSTGLTKREYFAGLAMQGIVGQVGYTSRFLQEAMTEAVLAADLLLIALEATNEQA